jgi:hypothetical protein
MFHKEILSAFAIALTLIAFLPYIRSIITGTVRPHVFSWVIWGTTTFVVFLAQLEDNAGAGAWPIGVSGTITILVAGLAYLKRGDVSITGADWFFLLAALSSLPFWYFTSDPLWAVVILTIVDLFGFGPTIRKAYNFPQSESVLFFVLFMTRNILVLAALENYSLTTVLFPAAMAATCFLLILIIAFRRRVMIN